MRDYSNMPEIRLADAADVARAKNQILHQEPIIVTVPEGFSFTLDNADTSCQCDDETGIYYDCDATSILSELADANGMQALAELAEVCRDSGSRFDLDAARHRIVIHD